MVEATESDSLKKLEALIAERMPERNLIDMLRDVDYWTNFTRHFGPLSGSDPKLERAVERYLLTTFTYGCNLGAAQAARHMRGIVTPRMLTIEPDRSTNTTPSDRTSTNRRGGFMLSTSAVITTSEQNPPTSQITHRSIEIIGKAGLL